MTLFMLTLYPVTVAFIFTWTGRSNGRLGQLKLSEEPPLVAGCRVGNVAGPLQSAPGDNLITEVDPLTD